MKYYIDNVQFEGNKSFSTSKLRRIIKLKNPGFIKRIEFNRRALKLDAITLKTFYASEGFLNATVKESFKIIDEGRVNVLFQIDEGKRSYLKSVSIEGNESIPQTKIQKILHLRVGKPFNVIALRQGYTALEREYRRIGKLYMSVEESYGVVEQIDLLLRIDEGPVVKINKILLSGLVSIDSLVVKRELQFSTDMLYNEDFIELSQRRLFETGLFSIVNIYPVKSQRGEKWVNVLIELREFAQKEFLSEGGLYSIQASSEGAHPKQGVGATVEWTNRNIFQSSTRFGLRATVEVPIEGARIKLPYQIPWVIRLESTLSRIWIGRLRLPTTARLFYENISELAFEEAQLERYGIDWNYIRKFSEESIMSGGLRWFKVQKGMAAISDDEQERSLRFNYRYRNLDNPMSPTKGIFFTLEPSLVGTFLKGSRHYYRMEIDYRRYSSNRASWVLALRTKLGRMEPFGKPSRGKSRLDLIPSYDQFYLGGSTSLRAWSSDMFRTQIDTIKTDTTSVDTIVTRLIRKGGLIKVLFNAEIRIPLWWRFGANFFIDGGILADNVSEFRQQWQNWTRGYGWDYGVELTISTPIGPVRVYYARRMNKKRSGSIIESIGFGFSHAF